MKVVLDTNIFISGIFWEGNYCAYIIEAWKSGKITLVSSLEIIQELVETLSTFKIAMSKETIREIENTVIENAIIVKPSEKTNIVKNDPDDNKFFEAAVAGNADYVISQDKKHVLSIKEYKTVKTISPEEFCKQFLSI